MSENNLSIKIHRTIRRWNGSTLVWDIEAYRGTVEAIREEGRRLVTLTPDQIFGHAHRFREEIRSGVDPDTLLVPSFALVAEAVRRVLYIDPFDEQLVCGIVLHQGKLAEMQTGEGKTLAAVFPVFLNALCGRGVHVLTFNDYLARRDAEWMGPVYRLLGLTVGFVQEGMGITERQSAYRQDVTYLTAKEAGFDFLRDNCRYDTSHIVQRDFHYAIVDEADSLLIDEARIPMIIAGATDEPEEQLTPFAQLARAMQPERHFSFDAYGRKISLTEEGIDFVEQQLGCGDLFTSTGVASLSRLYHALHAQYLLHWNVDYLVSGNRIELIDELTGRIAENRRWPEGLHAAVEVKEGVPAQSRGAMRSSITIHHFIAQYPKVAAMTATAEQAEEEFHDWYGLDTVIIPSHRECLRNDFPDRVYRTRREKGHALIEEIATVHATGRPILVGTRTVRESRELADVLIARGIDCRVLNAKDNAYEASIVAEAGTAGAVTISTNMAGRGTDIRLGGSDGKDRERVASLGGLYVIGTNRFESRRIDDQLRGRSGRQGDPGLSRFFISLEDDLFVKYRINELIPKRYIVTSADGCIENAYVNNEINRLQRIIEGQNGDIKFTLGKYSVLIEQQRTIVASYRREVLATGKAFELLRVTARPVVDNILARLGGETTAAHCRTLLLRALDRSWSTYLADMADLRDGIHFRRFGRQDPLHIFNSLAIERFETMLQEARQAAAGELERLCVDGPRRDSPVIDERHNPSATWTYLVSDNPFEDNPDLQLSGNMGYSVFAGLLWPLTAMMLMMKRRGRKS
ncbi:MAG: accessory Sec system translocase SecA2 [Chitinispirillaceae bacterium]|nr:accessory Sec system translocase SecA2 [Chitinispirillaceae bacterium]